MASFAAYPSAVAVFLAGGYLDLPDLRLIGLALFAIVFVLEWRLRRRYADLRIMIALLDALDEAIHLLDDERLRPNLRRRLRYYIRVAANEMRLVRGGLYAGGEYRRAVNTAANHCVAALLSFVPIAATGDRQQIEGLRDDVARAVLRVASGDWTQISALSRQADTHRSSRRERLGLLLTTSDLFWKSLVPLYAAVATIVKALRSL
jgi:hypothetical protein